MTKAPKNHRKAWTQQDVQKLDRLIAENAPTRVMALKLGRTPDAVYAKASELDRSVKPTNQSPYNRRKAKK